MKKQMVQDRMTPDPITVTRDTTLPEARRLMKEKAIRHLPVVEDGKLVGVVSLGDIRESSASDGTSLSVYELNHLLSNLPVNEFMTSTSIRVTPFTTIEGAAQLMLNYKIGSLPVVWRRKLLGIITASDIFRVLIDESKAA